MMPSGKLQLDDVAPRIRELRTKQEEFEITRNQIEAGMAVQGINYIDVNIVKAYAEDLRALLEEAEFSERKAFLRSFIKWITISGNQMTIDCDLPSPKSNSGRDTSVVLPVSPHKWR